MSPGPELSVTFTTRGDDVTRAVRSLSNEIRGLGRSQRQTVRPSNELARSFRNIALRTIGIIATVRAFDALTDAIRRSVSTGLEYNSTIEIATLSIASLITAQAELTDETGRQLQGVEALNAAYDIAENQIRALRIAGIQTAATTEELVDAFQQAVGAGIAAGLTLDEIRQVTIRIAQAAGALGVPYRQLNEEIRSILSGIIDQNTRIAKALGIQNEQVKLAREQGRLAEFLLEQFEAFGTAGERITGTFEALKSNLQEALQLFAGDATRPLFDALTTEGQAALQQIFDLDTAEVADSLQGLVQASQAGFEVVGDVLAESIRRGVDAAEALSGFLQENREEVEAIAREMGDVVRASGELVRSLSEIVAAYVAWGVETGVIAQGMETVADIIRFIADNKLVLGVIFGGAAGALASFIASFVGPTVLAVGGAIAAVTALAAAIDALVTTEREAREEARLHRMERREQIQTFADESAQAARLAGDYELLARRLQDEATSAEEAEGIRVRLAEIQEELLSLAPEYAAAIEGAADSHDAVAEAIRRETEAREQAIIIQAAEASVAELEARRALEDAREMARIAEQAKGAFGIFGGPLVGDVAEGFNLAELEAEADAAEKALNDLVTAWEQVRAALSGEGLTPTITPRAGDDDDGAAAKAALQAARARAAIETAEIKRALAERERELKSSLDRNAISFREYFDQLRAAQLEAIDRQVELQQNILTVTTGELERAQVEARIIGLQAQRAKTEAEIAEDSDEAQDKLVESVEKAQERLLKASGQTADALAQQLEREFADLIARLVAEGDLAGVEMVNRLINVEVARARLDELEQAVSQAQRRIRNRTQEIEILQEAGALTPREARVQLIEVYEDVAAQIALTIPRARELAQEIGDPESIARVQQLEIEHLRLRGVIRDLSDEFKEFREQAIQDAQNALVQFFTTGITQAESLLDAFRQLALGIVEAMQRAAAQIIALRIFEALSLTAGGFATGGQVLPSGRGELGVPAATGGLIRGPGGPTDDRIPAWLSSGEYVIRAAVVKEWGPEFFDALNRGGGRLRARAPDQILPRFAEGGLVEVAAGRGGGRGQDGRLDVGLNDEMLEARVRKYIQSPDGQRTVVRVMKDNRRSVQRMLG